MSEAIGEYCDALICETGHHSIDSTHEYLSNKKIDKIFYNHHGREILGAVEGCRERVKLLYGGRAAIADDGMTVEV